MRAIETRAAGFAITPAQMRATRALLLCVVAMGGAALDRIAAQPGVYVMDSSGRAER